MKQKNVFIAIAPNHILNFERIIDSNGDIENTLLLNPGNFEYNDNYWSEVVNGSLNLKYAETTTFNKLRFQVRKLVGYKKFIAKTKKHLIKECVYHYYYCNLDDVLSNHIFHYLNSKVVINSHIVEDGVLNYYHPNIDTSKLNSKKLFCKYILKINFIPEFKHPTGIYSESVINQYVRIPTSAICPEKSIKLPFSKIHFKPQEDLVLIIGQDIMHNSNEGFDYYKARLRALFSIIKKRTKKETKIVYKPHRNGDYSIAENILNDFFCHIEIFLDITPVEQCVSKIRPSSIFSFESSALLNLKIAFVDLNVYIGVLPYSKPQKNLLKIFNNIGIDILR